MTVLKYVYMGHPSLATKYRSNISSRVFSNSEASASELLKNLEENMDETNDSRVCHRNTPSLEGQCYCTEFNKN